MPYTIYYILYVTYDILFTKPYIVHMDFDNSEVASLESRALERARRHAKLQRATPGLLARLETSTSQSPWGDANNGSIFGSFGI